MDTSQTGALPGGPAYPMPQGANAATDSGNSPLAMLQQIATQRESLMDPNQSPLAYQRQGALKQTQDAMLTAGKYDPADEFYAIGRGAAEAPWSPTAAIASGMQKMNQMRDLLHQQEYQRQVGAADLGYEDAAGREKDFLSGATGSAGLMGIIKSSMVQDKTMVAQHNSIMAQEYAKLLEKQDPDAYGKAEALATKMTGLTTNDVRKLQLSFAKDLSPDSQGGQSNQMPVQSQLAQAQQDLQDAQENGFQSGIDQAKAKILSLTKNATLNGSATDAAGDTSEMKGIKVDEAQRLVDAIQDPAEKAKAQDALNAQVSASATQPARSDNPLGLSLGPNVEAEASAAGTIAGEKKKAEAFQNQAEEMAKTYTGNADQSTKDLLTFQHMQETLKDYVANGGNPGALAPIKAKLLGYVQQLGFGSPDDYQTLKGAELIKKLNFDMGAAAARGVSESRATQSEFAQGRTTVPGLEMYDPAAQQFLLWKTAQSHLMQKQQQDFTTWRSLFGNQDPGQFSSYWSMKTNNPDETKGITPATIKHFADKNGVAPIHVINEFSSQLSNGAQ